MEIRPLRNDADHAAALKQIESLWDAADGSLEADTLEVLAILVEDYESRRWPLPPGTPLDILHYAIAEMGHSQADLGRLLGSRSRASEILSGKRRLTLENVHKISTLWHIPAQLLIAPYHVEKAA